MMKNINESLINLTHAVINNSKGRVDSYEEIINHGIIFVDAEGPVKEVPHDIAQLAINSLGLRWEIWNSQFHKTWKKVADAPIEQLVWEQLINYFSTYGLESMGLTASPFIPVEDVLPEEMRPEIKKFVVVRIVSEKEAVELVNNYLKVTQRPKADNMIYISEFVEVTTIDPDDIASFEIKCLYCDIRKIYPKKNQDLLRYLVYLATDNTLIIKNNKTVGNIERMLLCYSEKANAVHDALSKADLVELSKIFLRNKRLFLAFKKDKRNASIINKIRRLAVYNHQPLSEITVANMMNLLAQGRKDDALAVINKTSNRNLIKLINYANVDNDTHIYNIRNGKVFINDKSINKDHMRWLYNQALKKLALNLSGTMSGKTYFIPDGVDYKAPISEKQMMGNIPYGTSISAPDDVYAICASIAWDDYKGERTDIDFHLQSATRSFGWNSSYRSGDEVLFSGDMTSAGTETYRFNVTDEVFLASISLFSGEDGCPFKFFLSGAENFRMKDTGMVDASKALTMPISFEFAPSAHSMSIGFIKDKAFTFYGGSLGSNIVPKRDLYAKALNAIVDRVQSMLSLKDLIEFAGGTIVNAITEENKDEIIDLSPENILSTTIFEIVDGKVD